MRRYIYHPDKVAALGPELIRVAEDRAKAITAAYRTLIDPESRSAYDRRGDAPPASHSRRSATSVEVILWRVAVGVTLAALYYAAMAVWCGITQMPDPLVLAFKSLVGEVASIVVFFVLLSSFVGVNFFMRDWWASGGRWRLGVLTFRAVMLLLVSFFALLGLGMFLQDGPNPALKVNGMTLCVLSLALVFPILFPRKIRRVWSRMTA